MDARSGREAEALIAEGLAEPIYRRGGDWPSIAAPARLRRLRENRPEVWERAHRMVMLGDWVLQRLSGEYVTDRSLGSSSALFDLGSRQWSSETAEELGIAHLLPPVHESGPVVGAVTEQAGRETGLAPGTPVVTGGARPRGARGLRRALPALDRGQGRPAGQRRRRPCPAPLEGCRRLSWIQASHPAA
jgi:autoinducer 2 (AI-2) kinase